MSCGLGDGNGDRVTGDGMGMGKCLGKHGWDGFKTWGMDRDGGAKSSPCSSLVQQYHDLYEM